jgi:NADP-reducing hydrogenase subunit HndB
VSKLSREALNEIRNQPEKREEYISIGMSACGIAAGAEEVYKILVEEVKKRKMPIAVTKCGCIGMCYAEPLVEVKVRGMPVVTYGKVNKDTALRILEEHVSGKKLLNDCIYDVK